MPKKLYLLAAFSFAAVLFSFLLWQNHALCRRDYSFISERLPEGWSGGKIAVVSDLHGKEFGPDNEKLLQMLRSAAPDLIAVTGDLCDERSGSAFVPQLLDALTDIAPTCYVTGNHEWASGVMPELRAMLEDSHAVYLCNTWQSFEKNGEVIVLAGVEDPNGYADQPAPAEVAAGVPQDSFWILLAHRNNEYPTYGTLGADLILSGHAHGGLVRLPGTDGLFGPGAEFLPKWTSGFYTDYPSPLFVSRGLGNSVPIPRIFNRPELAIITLLTE